ncbi:hypothetical protein [Burkholderia sp. FL-7-2-10-S1-D7]|uniref:hypothetical protein n=1 Tax=Burkholderia sp. FL-7-2-10-S1-D7 TaxID=1637866 RepID=UPI0012E39AD0|nr:hypothetical protein [Burkholderia sp. FL-7-2-10-S1-D7]
MRYSTDGCAPPAGAAADHFAKNRIFCFRNVSRQRPAGCRDHRTRRSSPMKRRTNAGRRPPRNGLANGCFKLAMRDAAPDGRSTLLGARTARRGSFGGVARPESAGIKPLGDRFAEPVAMGIDTFTRRNLRDRHHTSDSSVKILTRSRIVHPFEYTIKKEKIRWLTATLAIPDRHSRETGSAHSPRSTRSVFNPSIPLQI